MLEFESKFAFSSIKVGISFLFSGKFEVCVLAMSSDNLSQADLLRITDSGSRTHTVRPERVSQRGVAISSEGKVCLDMSTM